MSFTIEVGVDADAVKHQFLTDRSAGSPVVPPVGECEGDFRFVRDEDDLAGGDLPGRKFGAGERTVRRVGEAPGSRTGLNYEVTAGVHLSGIGNVRAEGEIQRFADGFLHIVQIGKDESQSIFFAGDQTGRFLGEFVGRLGAAGEKHGVVAGGAVVALAALDLDAEPFLIAVDEGPHLGGAHRPAVRLVVEIAVPDMTGIEAETVFFREIFGFPLHGIVTDHRLRPAHVLLVAAHDIVHSQRGESFQSGIGGELAEESVDDALVIGLRVDPSIEDSADVARASEP